MSCKMHQESHVTQHFSEPQSVALQKKIADCDSESFVLGIDVGTTSIKVSLLRNSTRDVVESFRCETGANICADELSFAEQDFWLFTACSW